MYGQLALLRSEGHFATKKCFLASLGAGCVLVVRVFSLPATLKQFGQFVRVCEYDFQTGHVFLVESPGASASSF